MAPKGQAIVQTLQPTQTSAETSFAPVDGLTVIASTGQTTMHQAPSHCVHVEGTLTVPPSKIVISITDFEGLNAPTLPYEHIISHW
jgi:hypothetical protein